MLVVMFLASLSIQMLTLSFPKKKMLTLSPFFCFSILKIGRNTTGYARFAVRHGRMAEARTRTAQPLPCGFCPGARQRAHDAFLHGVGKGNTRHRSLSCATCDARQRKGVDGRPQRDGITRSLPCATQILTAQKKEKKEKSKVGRGPPPPGHDHAVVGRRSSVPYASDATTTTRRPHRSVRRCLTSAAPPGAWATARVGMESSRRGRISGLCLRGQDEKGGSHRAAAGARAAAAGSKGAATLRSDPVPDGGPPLPPHPGKKEVRGEEEARHCRYALGRRGSGALRCGGGGGRTPRRVMAGDARGGSGALATAATDEIGGAGRGGGRGGAGRGQRKREGPAVAPRAGRRKREGPAGRGRRVRLGRGRGAGKIGFGGGVGCFYTRVDPVDDWRPSDPIRRPVEVSWWVA
jgi:hypothetical protein